ncbi:hypothetical protein FNQ90_02950 [Streptomyces alkaliphilus]|uniref:Histidine kinase/HSP90-like ATPase domain-containing protein n=1 Tax=Streptomyces alkaliphilus TaxID=1472722 RepID=A0A7W3TA61_9ACTN|nr:hypothetical protein [Streptomyces alkaliphilus]
MWVVLLRRDIAWCRRFPSRPRCRPHRWSGRAVGSTSRCSGTPVPRGGATRLAIEWGHPDPAPTVALVAGELAANAVLHGCSRQRPFGVRVVLHGAALRVEVSDGRADRLPFRRSAGPQETFGRGLLLVEAVADRWGVTVDAGGKTVWAEVDVSPGADRPATPATDTRRPGSGQGLRATAPAAFISPRSSGSAISGRHRGRETRPGSTSSRPSKKRARRSRLRRM